MKASPITMRPTPAATRTSRPMTALVELGKSRLPVPTNTSAIPNKRVAKVMAVSRKYLKPASSGLTPRPKAMSVAPASEIISTPTASSSNEVLAASTMAPIPPIKMSAALSGRCRSSKSSAVRSNNSATARMAPPSNSAKRGTPASCQPQARAVPAPASPMSEVTSGRRSRCLASTSSKSAATTSNISARLSQLRDARLIMAVLPVPARRARPHRDERALHAPCCAYRPARWLP